jgi:hypothetical protein
MLTFLSKTIFVWWELVILMFEVVLHFRGFVDLQIRKWPLVLLVVRSKLVRTQFFFICEALTSGK